MIGVLKHPPKSWLGRRLNPFDKILNEYGHPLVCPGYGCQANRPYRISRLNKRARRDGYYFPIVDSTSGLVTKYLLIA
jgi:hypothetical protein